MMRAMTYEKLTELVVAAIPATLARIGEAHAGEHLTGYALLTDDALSTLSHVACTEESLSEKKHVRFAEVSPVEWTIDDGRGAFDDARAMLSSLYRATSSAPTALGEHVERAFAALVTALAHAKASGHFGEDVVLVVTSTDPSEELEELASRAVADLNAPDVVELWKSAFAP